MTKNVFLSSTSKGLEVALKGAYKAISAFADFKCIHMEDFSRSSDSSAKVLIKEQLDNCKLFVGLVGPFFGRKLKGEELSYTQWEYFYARSKGIPTLMFFTSDEFEHQAKLRENDQEWQSQENFRAKVKEEGDLTYSHFSSSQDVGRIVGEALRIHEERNRNPEPKRLKPKIIHPYGLKSDFVGRADELAQLSSWFEQGPTTATIVGMAGQGKSALAYKWLHDSFLDSTQTKRCDGPFWWSFSPAGTTFISFLEQAAGHFYGDVSGASTESDLLQLLLSGLQNWPAPLLVLDDFEKVLPSPQSQGRDHVEHGLGSAPSIGRDPVTDFLDSVAGLPHVRLLITSQVVPSSVKDKVSHMELPLDGLSLQDAESYLRNFKIKGSKLKFRMVINTYDRHPMALSLLASLITSDLSTPQHIDAADNIDPTKSLEGLLEVKFSRLSESTRSMLFRASAMSRPFSYDSIAALCPNLGRPDVVEGLNELEREQLIMVDKPTRVFSMHQIVRSAAYKRLERPAEVHAFLVPYFAKLAKYDLKQETEKPVPAFRAVSRHPLSLESKATAEFDRLEKLQPQLELFHHMVRAGMYQEAWRMYMAKIHEEIVHAYVAYDTAVSMLSELVDESGEIDGRIDDVDDQCGVLNALGNGYSLADLPFLAKAFLDKAVEIAREKRGSWLGVCLVNAAVNNSYLGFLEEARSQLHEAVATFSESDDSFGRIVSSLDLGRVLTLMGDFESGETMLRKGIADLMARKPNSDENIDGAISLGLAYLSYSSILKEDYVSAESIGKEALGQAKVGRFPRDIVRASWILSRAIALKCITSKSELDSLAQSLIDDAAKRCKNIFSGYHRLNVKITRAWVEIANDCAPQGIQTANSAKELAEAAQFQLELGEVEYLLGSATEVSADVYENEGHADRAFVIGQRTGCPSLVSRAEKLLMRNFKDDLSVSDQ